ncbi:hypothetical protein GAY29_11890 [Azospirillum brasilense]|uniref:hypothetical protein n=1 Tax=Azospirillum brasilense TaxID=192 RepID=UPI00190D95E4|nr:hypothetical protein [Azospirillum brasilense]MBK3733808.1 hypothetical protein [Azospirillum brasilense]
MAKREGKVAGKDVEVVRKPRLRKPKEAPPPRPGRDARPPRPAMAPLRGVPRPSACRAVQGPGGDVDS